MSALSPKARALLSRTSKKYEPSTADRERLRRGLAARGGMGAATTAAAAAATSVATKAAAAPVVGPSATSAGAGIAAKSGVGIAVKIVASVALVASVGATTVVLTKPHDMSVNARSQAPSSAVAPIVRSATAPNPSEPTALEVAAVISAPLPASTTAPSVAPATGARSRSVPAVVAPTNVEDPLTAEVALLRTAQGALRNHDGARALEALDTHARRFPDGVLAEERAAARVFALCELGRSAEARSAKASFLSLHPSSPTAERVRKACGPGSGDSTHDQ